jgi:SAM-dependent methyltransferase
LKNKHPRQGTIMLDLLSPFKRRTTHTSRLNAFDSADVAARYEEWYSGRGRQADFLEIRLLEKLLADFPGSQTVVEIGCGTGHFCRWLRTKNLKVTGLDISPAMLAEAHRLDGADYVMGDALRLPFLDRAFDLAVLITTLEFVSDPLCALREAARVARRGLILGVLNRWSLLALRHWLSGKPPWNSARFFGPYELMRLVRVAAGSRFVSARWRTTIFPMIWVADLPLPWGGFIALAAKLADD